MADDKFDLELRLDGQGVNKGFKTVEDAGKRTAENISKSFQVPLKSIAAGFAGVAAAAATYLSFRAIKNGFVSATQAAIENQDAVTKLNSALALANSFSEETSFRFQSLARELERTTNTSAQTAMELSALALSYGFTAKGAETATRAAVDFAAAAGISTTEALRRLGRSISGSVGDLSRFVPEVAKLTKEQLAAGEAADLIAKRFAGSAAASINTFSGQLQALRLRFGSFLEAIGNIIVRSPALIALFQAIGDQFAKVTSSINEIGKSTDSFGATDIFKQMIINFSVVMQAGTETARRIGLSFQLAALRAIQAWHAFKVLSTAGLSEAFNQELLNTLNRIDEVKKAFSEDSAVTKFFDDLILRVTATSGRLKDLGDEIKNIASDTSGVMTVSASEIESALDRLKPVTEDLGELISEMRSGFNEAAWDMAANAEKSFSEMGRYMFRALGDAAGQAFAAFGRAIAKGENALQGFIDSLLASMGQMAVQLGTQFILQGIAYMFAGMANGASLIAAGAALAAFGGILSAVGGGTEGAKQGQPGFSLGGGVMADPSSSVAYDLEDERQARIVVNIQGDVLDSRESGLRIVELINEAFDTQGARVVTA